MLSFFVNDYLQTLTLFDYYYCKIFLLLYFNHTECDFNQKGENESVFI